MNKHFWQNLEFLTVSGLMLGTFALGAEMVNLLYMTGAIICKAP